MIGRGANCQSEQTHKYRHSSRPPRLQSSATAILPCFGRTGGSTDNQLATWPQHSRSWCREEPVNGKLYVRASTAGNGSEQSLVDFPFLQTSTTSPFGMPSKLLSSLTNLTEQSGGGHKAGTTRPSRHTECCIQALPNFADKARPCLDDIKVPSFFTLSLSHQFLDVCM